jgi:hypothetical protein
MAANNPKTPLNMAKNARDNLQASAREWMRNLEDVISKKNSGTTDSASLKESANPIESAIRTMFGSCTTGADSSTSPPSVREDTSFFNSRSRTRSFSSNSPHSAKKSIALDGELPLQQKEDLGEHIYAQLFYDDQARATKALSALRNNDAYPKNERASPNTKVPKPFHVSSPSRHHIPMVTPARPIAAPPLASEELEVPGTLTFDDSISAISAHTLEAMAQTVKHSRSDMTRDSSVFQDIPDKRETLGASRMPYDSPARLDRSRSNQTWGSKNSRNSHSTRTTESSSFEHMWNREEKKYWEQETVEHRDKNSVNRESRSQKSRSQSNKVCRCLPLFTLCSVFCVGRTRSTQ